MSETTPLSAQANNYKSTYEEENEKSDCVDLVERTIGSFGRWQFQECFLMCLLKNLAVWYEMSIIYLNPNTDFWCKLPPNFHNSSESPSWPYDVPNFNKIKVEEGSCFLKVELSPNSSVTTPCLWGYNYNRSVIRSSIVTDWNLVCGDQYLANLSQTILMGGLILGSLLLGLGADKFLLGLAVGGMTVTSTVLNMEVVGNKWRALTSNTYQSFVGIGYVTMAGLAYIFRDWRGLQLSFTFFNICCISYICLIDESPRWLMVSGDQHKTKKLLDDICKSNGTKKCVDLEVLHSTNNVHKENSLGLTSLFRTPRLQKYTIILSFNWFLVGIICLGLGQYVGQATEDIYAAVAISGVCMIPGNFVSISLIKSYGRRRTALLSSIIIPFLFLSILNITTAWIKIIFYGLNFFILGIFVCSFRLLTNEMYPTVIRNCGVGFLSTLQRSGAMIAPLLLSQTWINPIWIFLFLSVWQPLLIYPLLETYENNLNDTIEDFEQCTLK